MIAYDIGSPKELFERYSFYAKLHSLLLAEIWVVGDDAKAEALEECAQPFSDHTHSNQSYSFTVDACPVECLCLILVVGFVIISYGTVVASARKNDL